MRLVLRNTRSNVIQKSERSELVEGARFEERLVVSSKERTHRARDLKNTQRTRVILRSAPSAIYRCHPEERAQRASRRMWRTTIYRTTLTTVPYSWHIVFVA
jgi:hypothetical protein